MTKDLEDVGTAAAELEVAPSELGLWLRLARALETAGQAEQAECAYAALGEAASDLGSVALAVACAWWLADNGHKDAAAKLVDQISSAHCRGSSRLDKKLRRPPVPPPAESGELGLPLGDARTDPIAAANEAIALAVATARKRKPAALAPTPLVSVLDAAEVEQLIGQMNARWRGAGNVVVDVGQSADTLYWIARGKVVVTRGDHALGDLGSNAFFGEIALLTGTTRTARVTCAQRCWLLEMPAAAVEKIAARAPRLAKVLANYARARLLANVMRTSELFSRLTQDERRELLPKFETRFVQEGETVVARGDENSCLYVVASGGCDVRDEDGSIASLTVGDAVGEMSLLKRQPATADVVATDRSVLLALGREQFDTVADKHPGLLAEVYKLLVTREKENRDAIVHDASDLII